MIHLDMHYPSILAVIKERVSKPGVDDTVYIQMVDSWGRWSDMTLEDLKSCLTPQ